MIRRTTGYKRPHGLTIEQRNAIDLLVTGAVDRAVAEEVGVSRVTNLLEALAQPLLVGLRLAHGSVLLPPNLTSGISGSDH